MKNKILIISHNPFSKITNNGKTLEVIFSKFSKEEIIQLYFVEDKRIDKDYASSYFKITDKEVVKSLLSIESKVKGTNLGTGQVKKNKFTQLLIDKKHTFAYFRDLLWRIARPQNDIKLHDWISENRPEFIFFVAGNQDFSHKMTRSLSKKYNINYGVFFTDDYILYPQRDSFLKKLQYRKLIKAYHETISKASICFSIGEMMSSEYEKEFKKKFYPIMNMVSISTDTETSINNKKFTISYFGGFHLNRWKMLVEFANELDSNIIDFNVYSSFDLTCEMSNSFKNSNIVFKGYVEGEDLKLAMVKSDALIHVESNDLINKSLTKLSVSTKIPEYLSTGKLVIGYGPADVASMKLIADNNLGIVIENTKDIKNTIEIVSKDLKLLKEYSNRALEFVKENFDIDKNSAKFKDLIENKIKN